MSSLSVVIPATDARATLPRVVAAVSRAHRSPEELIVVDEPRGLGPAAARNLGARRALGDVLVFVDADVEVHEDVFVRIRDAFERDPDLAALFGSYDDDPGEGGVVSDFRNLLHHHVHQQGAGAATTFWAGLGAIRRELFLELGGFDEERFARPSIEDIELGARLHARGARLILDPRIQGKHLKRWSLTTMTTTDLLRRGVPWMRLVLEKRTRMTGLNLGWRHRLSTIASLVLLYGLVRRSSRLIWSMLTLLVLLDWSFYSLLLRRRGPRLAAVGVPLQLIHRLTAAAAALIALAAHASTASRRRQPLG